MLSKIAVLSSLAILAVANIIPASQCNPGPVQCCQSVESSNDPVIQAILHLLGITISGTDIPVGVTCTPITVVGISSGTCTAQPVCCLDNSFNGIIAIGCTPVNLSL